MSSNKIIVPTKKVKSIQFSILSPEEIRNMGYVEIIHPDGIENGEIKSGSMYDPKLGVTTRGIKCHTCELTSDKDAGHFSYIKFAEPIINTEFLGDIKEILKCICFKCGSFLIPTDNFDMLLQLKQHLRLKKCVNIAEKIATVCKSKGCENYKKPLFSKYFGFGIEIKLNKDTKDNKDNKDEKRPIRPKYIKYLFSKLTNKQIEVLGYSPIYSRPENMIFVYYPIAPPSLRPVIQTSDNKKSEDDLFRQLTNILNKNTIFKELLLKNKNDKEYISANIQKNHDNLSALVANIINKSTDNNFKVQYSYNPNHKIKSIHEILEKKKGLFRGNMIGKRVNFVGRSVICPDNDIEQYEVGIPQIIAKSLQYGEIVNNYNIEELKKYIINGSDVYPGANYVYTTSHTLSGKKLENRKSRTKLSIFPLEIRKIIANDLDVGDVVERHVIDGDIILLNRQPSLHRYSLLGYKVKIFNDNEKVISLFITNTSPHNADFDGDEMNLFLMNSILSQVEVRNISFVSQNFVGIGASNTIIYPIQDNVLGSYLITKNGNKLIDSDLFMTIVTHTKYYDPFRVKPDENNQYKLIDTLSCILPDSFNININGFIVINGIVKSGILTKSIIKKALIKPLFQKYGELLTSKFTFAFVRLTNKFLSIYGATLSINDLIIEDKITETINKNLANIQTDIYKLLNKFDNGEIVISLTNTPEEIYESEVDTIINKYQKLNADLLTSYFKNNKNFIGEQNNLYNMIDSGSKGSEQHLIQIKNCLGPQKIMKTRALKNSGSRTLPLYPKGSEDPRSRGMVYTNFSTGMTCNDAFHHAKAGRSGLSDTALGTANVGYMSRKQSKMNEGQFVSYDNMVRDHDNRIISFNFGASHFDTSKLNKYTIDLYNITDEMFNIKYSY